MEVLRLFASLLRIKKILATLPHGKMQQKILLYNLHLSSSFWQLVRLVIPLNTYELVLSAYNS